jgi:hypothetical protein
MIDDHNTKIDRDTPTVINLFPNGPAQPTP